MNSCSRGNPMKCFLALVAGLFIGLLILVVIGAERADPVILDEQGHPRGAASASPFDHRHP